MTTIAMQSEVKLLTLPELYETILVQCKKSARTSLFKFGSTNVDVSDLEGYLVTELYSEFSRIGSEFRTIRMVNRLIRLRTVNYIERESSPLDNQTTFSAIDGMYPNSEDDADNFERRIPDNSDFELGNALKDFVGSLSDKQRQILDLHVAGYLNNEIALIVGCHINTITNTMKKIKELAIAFGL